MLAFIPLFLVSLGGVVNSDGQYLYKYYSHQTDMDYKGYVAVEFGGALGALIFYVSRPGREASMSIYLRGRGSGTSISGGGAREQVYQGEGLGNKCIRGRAQEHCSSSIPGGGAQEHCSSSIPGGGAQEHCSSSIPGGGLRNTAPQVYQGEGLRNTAPQVYQGEGLRNTASQDTRGWASGTLLLKYTGGGPQEHCSSSIPGGGPQEHCSSSIPGGGAQEHCSSSISGAGLRTLLLKYTRGWGSGSSAEYTCWWSQHNGNFFLSNPIKISFQAEFTNG